MASIIKTAIQDVLAQAATISGALYCAVYNNQVKEEQGGKTFDFPKPAILIEIDTPNEGLQTLGIRNVTVSELTWRFYIVHEQLDAANGTLDQNLDVFDYRDMVKVAFTQFQPKNCSYFMYREESQDYAHNNIYVYSIAFKCSYVDTKGSMLDPDSGQLIPFDPPIALDLQGYITTPQPPATHIAYGWKACHIDATIVASPDGTTQQLANGDIIPLQYVVNDDGTVTIPELASYPGIVVLSNFLIDRTPYDGYITVDYTTGTITNSGGGFIRDNVLSFDATLPLYTPS